MSLLVRRLGTFFMYMVGARVPSKSKQHYPTSGLEVNQQHILLVLRI